MSTDPQPAFWSELLSFVREAVPTDVQTGLVVAAAIIGGVIVLQRANRSTSSRRSAEPDRARE
jgi:hypothetical protein